MAKDKTPFDWLRLYQIDYVNGEGSPINELSMFVINGDGSWYEMYDIAGDSTGLIRRDGQLTSGEFKELVKHFTQFEKKAHDMVEGVDVTLTDYYNFDGVNDNRGFYNVIYDNGSMQAIEGAPHKVVERLDDYMRELAAKYAHDFIL